jgi:hypothetical protein
VRDHAPGEWVVVTEDDHELSSDVDFPLYQRAAEKLGADVVFLGYLFRWHSAAEPGVIMVDEELGGNHFYMITPAGAKRLLEALDPRGDTPIDTAISNLGPYAVACGPEPISRPLPIITKVSDIGVGNSWNA